jgi:hypothetical protein
MNCEECNKPIEEIKDCKVEWISSDDWALSMYIRIVHPDCCYYEKKREILEEMDANDLEMPWDSKRLAKSAFLHYINERNQQTRGTTCKQ